MERLENLREATQLVIEGDKILTKVVYSKGANSVTRHYWGERNKAIHPEYLTKVRLNEPIPWAQASRKREMAWSEDKNAVHVCQKFIRSQLKIAKERNGLLEERKRREEKERLDGEHYVCLQDTMLRYEDSGRTEPLN
ncbi:hypothetical protein STEG23_021580 [Scotinomys teguina]